MIPRRETPLMVGGWRHEPSGAVVHWTRYVDPRFQAQALEAKQSAEVELVTNGGRTA